MLKAFFTGLFTALFGWLQKQAEKPKTLTDAQTPENIRRDWNDYVSDQLRDKPDSSDRLKP